METQTIIKSNVTTSFGKICYRYVGTKGNPLFLIIHGSGVNNSGKVYKSLLFEYYARYINTWKLCMIALDCPGYGESTGLKSAIRSFPENLSKNL